MSGNRSRTPLDGDTPLDEPPPLIRSLTDADSARFRRDDRENAAEGGSDTTRSAPAAFMRADERDTDTPLTVTFQIPFWSEMAVLPGSTIVAKAAYKLFREGVVFATREDGEVAHGGEDGDETVDAVAKILSNDGAVKKRIGKGSFNLFYEIEEYYAASAVAVLGYDPDDPAMRMVGKRTQMMPLIQQAGEDEAVFQKRRGNLFHEVWISLIAGAVGIAPRVHCAYLKDGNRLTMFIQRGKMGLDRYLDADYIYQNTVREVSQSLDVILARASSMGLVLTDIKPENMIVMNDNTLRFIDFDPVFTMFVNADSDCVELINILLLCNSVHCFFPNTAGMMVTKDIRRRLRERLLPKFENDLSTSSLCGMLLTLYKDEAQKYPKLETLFRAQSTQHEAIAQHVLFMAGHYAGWAVGKDYECGRDIDNNSPVIEQIAEKIMLALGVND
jgi:hypothetical protein